MLNIIALLVAMKSQIFAVYRYFIWLGFVAIDPRVSELEDI